MGFNLKSGNSPSFKGMGSSPNKSAFKAVEGDNDAHVQAYNAEKAAKAKPKMDNDKWSAGNEAAKKNTGGTSLNDLVAKRKTLEKGSNEYNINQNSINKALGNSKRYDVAEAAPQADAAEVKENKLTGRTTTTTTREDPNNPNNTITRDTKRRKDNTISKITDEDSPNMAGDIGKGDKKRVWKDQPGREGSRNVVKSGRDTTDKSDDVKKVTKVRGGDKQTQSTRTRTADTVTKTKHDLATGESTSKSRKRLGKGLVKDVVAKAKANRANKKAGKAKGSKAPKGTTYDPSDDSSNRPV